MIEMMKIKVLTAMFAIATVFVLLPVRADAAADPVGTWKYTASEAPYEYSKGDMIITRDEGDLKGTLKVNYQTIGMRDVKMENNSVQFGVYIEGEYIRVSLDLDGDKFSGKASYSEGSVQLVGERVQ